jgi:tRNA A22 N-methylase
MIEISIALVVIAGIGGWLINKWLDMQIPINITAPESNIEHFQAQLDALRKELNEFKLQSMIGKR